VAIHKNFPPSPFVVLDPSIRWFPADETLREGSSDRLMPPLVPELRKKVKIWRDSGYDGATKTSKSLLTWWFDSDHLNQKADGSWEVFQYYFAQREALETIIYLYEIVGAQDKYDLFRFDSSGKISSSLFPETWRRYVVKMATGSGKTKVLSLVLAWSYFHRLYETNSTLSRNFLVIAPNIIVLDRIYKDFKSLNIFLNEDPILPDNGFAEKNWRDDFQLTLHLQDDVHVTHATGNIFLTNIQRVYSGSDTQPSVDDDVTLDYFLGLRPTGSTSDSKIDLGIIVRDIEELMILNDEAHHIHDPGMAWFKSIEDIHNRMLQKGLSLSMQVDVTATPKHSNGAIFVQTISDYPLVEAISQNVVKHPVLPDAPSRAKMVEHKSAIFTEKYEDYLNLGVIEWRKAFDEHQKAGKKSILFVMTDDTRNCDDVAHFLESRYQDLKGAVLVIHTKSNGEISEANSGKSKIEMDILREQANSIDSLESPYKAIVSVMVLKEGWDVRNVTTIVGLRAYTSKSNILPEQTLGRGLRKMYSSDVQEFVSVIGTNAFMEFVESIQAEGVILERKPMGTDTPANTPMIIEIDKEKTQMEIERLDIEIPVLRARVFREYRNLHELDPSQMGNTKLIYKEYSVEEQREIIFKDITTGEKTHSTNLDTAGNADYRSVISYFAQTIMREMRLVSGYEVLYPKVKSFVSDYLFDRRVALDSADTLRNLSEVAAAKTILESFTKAVNALTVRDRGDSEIRDYIKLRNTRPFAIKNQGHLLSKKSIFNRIVGDNNLESLFVSFLERAEDVESYTKNYFAIKFKIDYINSTGGISNYFPDFLVKSKDGNVYIIETKGNESLDDPLKLARLKQWCLDVNALQDKVNYDFVFVDEESFRKYKPSNLKELVKSFLQYK